MYSTVLLLIQYCYFETFILHLKVSKNKTKYIFIVTYDVGKFYEFYREKLLQDRNTVYSLKDKRTKSGFINESEEDVIKYRIYRLGLYKSHEIYTWLR